MSVVVKEIPIDIKEIERLSKLPRKSPEEVHNDLLLQLVRGNFDELTRARSNGVSWEVLAKRIQGKLMGLRSGDSFPIEQYYEEIRKEKSL